MQGANCRRSAQPLVFHRVKWGVNAAGADRSGAGSMAAGEKAMPSRQQQRQQERALVKRGEAAITAGLAVKPDKADVVAVSLVLARLLADTNDPHRATTAAARMHALSEASTRRTPGTAKLACAKGCGYCCHTWVSATAPEIFLLARAVRADEKQRAGVTVDVVARCRDTAGLTPLQRYGAKLPCPLLVENACSRYRDRPTVCRQATALDLQDCLEEFEGKRFESDIRVSSVYLAHARNARTPMLAALRLTGLDACAYELSAGLSRALEFNNAEARWLAGDDVFAGVARSPEEPPAIEQAIAVIEGELAAAMSKRSR